MTWQPHVALFALGPPGGNANRPKLRHLAPNPKNACLMLTCLALLVPLRRTRARLRPRARLHRLRATNSQTRRQAHANGAAHRRTTLRLRTMRARNVRGNG